MPPRHEPTTKGPDCPLVQSEAPVVSHGRRGDEENTQFLYLVNENSIEGDEMYVFLPTGFLKV